MKENLQEKLVEILTGIQSAVANGSDFVLTQLPEVAQQYIAFGRAFAFVELAFVLVIFASGLYFFIKLGLLSKKVDNYGDWAVQKIVSTAGGAITTIVGGLATIFSLKELLMVWFAPKVWLLIELARLINPGR
jgi:hypothetical protein